MTPLQKHIDSYTGNLWKRKAKYQELLAVQRRKSKIVRRGNIVEPKLVGNFSQNEDKVRQKALDDRQDIAGLKK